MDRPTSEPNEPVIRAEHRQGSLDTTSRLFDQIRQGNDAAREALFARIAPALTRWAHRRLPSGSRSFQDTEDLVQVSLVRAFERLEGFEPRGRGSFLGYVRQILLNALRDELRRAARTGASNPRPQRLEEVTPALEQTIGEDTVKRYEQALAGLPPLYQEAVVLRIELDQTYADIAETLGLVSSEAARKVIGRAIAKLAESMRDLRS